MKKFVLFFLLLIISMPVFAQQKDISQPFKLKISKNQDADSIVRFMCTGDQIRKNKSNKVAGTIFTFSIKNGKLYDRSGTLLKKAVVTDEYIKGKIKYRNGLSWENTRFQINRYTGAFSYHTIYRTLEGASEYRNSGMCKLIKNERLF